MDSPSTAQSIVLGVGLLLLAGEALVAVVTSIAAERFFRRPTRALPARVPSVSILKPVRGVDDGALENFRSFARQDYPDYEVVFGVAEPGDPAVEIIRRVQAEFGSERVRLAFGGPETFVNAKVSNLGRALAVARGEVLVINDSDCRVRPDYLARVVHTLGEPGVGLVTCLPVLRDARNLPAALEVIALNSFTVPSGMIPWMAGRMDFAIGATLALRRETLEKIGGLARIGNVIADDCALGEAVAAAGLKVTLAPVLVEIVHERDTLAGHFRHMMRWGRTVRAVRPGPYAAMGLGLWAIPMLTVAILAGFAPWTGFLASGAALFRMGLLAWLNARFIHDSSTWRYLPVVLAYDLVAPLGWLACFFGSTVEWRGQRYRVRQGGRLERIGGEGAAPAPAAQDAAAEDATA